MLYVKYNKLLRCLAMKLRPSLLAAVVAAAASFAPSASAAEPTCLTPVGEHEPPCNPYLAASGWSAAHRGSYASGSSSFPAPHVGDAVGRQHVLLPGQPTQVPVIIDFTGTYPDGSRVAWMSVVSSPDIKGVHKVDVATGQVIDSLTQPASSLGANITGAYNVLDRDNHLFVGRQRSLDVFGDAVPGNPRSKIRQLANFALPEGALCGADDKLVGITMTYDGHVAYASERGAVGVVPRDVAQLKPENVKVLQLNAGRCDDDTASLEIVSNSISADEDGGIYVVTSKRMNRVDWDGSALKLGWSAPYASGAASGVRLGDGSGSTPDVVGTGRDTDRFVVITDGQKLMHLVYMWRDRIPADWRPIAPGKDRRIACEVPVTFGDPTAVESTSEQSVLTSGYTSVVVNNALKDAALFSALPAAQRQTAAALAGQDPVNAPYGMERFDWDPTTRTCRSVWANRKVSIPNAVPTLSLDSGLIYSDGQRNGQWGLEGLDLATGEQKLWVPASRGVDSNSIYAATEVGPDGAIWQGTGGGIDIYRGPQRPAPALRCYDLTAPTLGPVRRAGRTVSGTARDLACGSRHSVRVALRAKGWRRTVKVPRGGRWRVTVPTGTGVVSAVAVDAAGQRSARRSVG